MAEAQAAAPHAVAPDDPAPEVSQRSGSEGMDAADASSGLSAGGGAAVAPARRTYLHCAQQISSGGATSQSTHCQAAEADDDALVTSSDRRHDNIERHQAFAVAAAERFAKRQLSRLRKRCDDGDVVSAATETATPQTEAAKPDRSVGFRHPSDSFVDRPTDGHPSDVGPSAQAVAYCSGKLNRLCRHQKSSGRPGTSGEGSKAGSTGRDAVSAERQPSRKKSVTRKAKVKRAATVQLPVEFKRKLNRMRIENLLHNLSEACKVQLHDPNRCRKCSKRLSEESRERFLQRHRTRLESALVARRYESHLVRSMPLAAVGSVAEGLPRLGDSPSATWGRLVRKATKPPE